MKTIKRQLFKKYVPVSKRFKFDEDKLLCVDVNRYSTHRGNPFRNGRNIVLVIDKGESNGN